MEFIRVRCIPIIHLDVSLDEFAGEEGLQVISDGAAKLVINHKAVINYSNSTRARLSIEF